MPFNEASKRLQALFAFVDEFEPGDAATRTQFDLFMGDMVASINSLAAYLETLLTTSTDQRFIGLRATVPNQRADATPLQAGDFYISTAAPAGRVGVMYRYTGSTFAVVSDFPSIGDFFRTTLAQAADPAAARGALELGSAALQAESFFAPASAATAAALAIKLLENGLAKTLTDWNDAHTTGPGTTFLAATAAAGNAPAAVNLSAVYVAYDANNGFLIAASHNPAQLYFRVRSAGTWGTWLSLANVLSIAGLTLVAGDLLYATGPGAVARLPKGTALQGLRMKSDGTSLEYVSEPFLRAAANFNGIPVSGTYTRTGNIVTCSITAHDMITGEFAWLNYTSGLATDGWYPVTVIDANTFTVVDPSSGATSGSLFRDVQMRFGFNISQIVRNTNGDYTLSFTTPMPDRSYLVSGVGNDGTPDTTFRSINLGPRANILTTSVRILQKGVNSANQTIEDAGVICVEVKR